MGLYTITLTGIENQILNAARSSHTTAGSIGEFFQEMMDQAIQSGHTADSAMDVMRMMLREAIDASPTSNSAMALLRTNLDAQVSSVESQVLDEARSSHTTAGSIGEFFQEMMDQAVQGAHTAESGLDVLRRISAETVGSVTTGSLMDVATVPPTAAAIADQVWDEAQSGHTTAGSFGQDADVAVSSRSSHSATDVWAAATRVLTANTNLNDPTAAVVADAVWDELQSAHVVSGSFGEDADVAVSSRNSTTPPTAAAVADQVWDEARSGHTTAGTSGEFLQEMMDEAIVSDNTTESGLDVIRRISAETMGTVTANSLMAKLTGMTDNQTVGTSSGLALTFDNTSLSLTASQTDATTPASGESDFGTYVCGTSISGVDQFEFSGDSGTTFEEIAANQSTLGFGTVGEYLVFSGVGNSTGRYRIVTDANAGTRIWSQNITTFS